MIEIKQTDENYPKRLLEIKDPPEKLYVEGNVDLLNSDSIAIVGTRKYTQYGKRCTERFANQLSKKGICIVSGLASGIDTIAHINSMQEKGKTIAVLGSGFNHIFPPENRILYERILENDGCIITEYPPETPVDKAKFPKRNRIISGISMGTLVIEARHRSGTSITARHAIDQHRDVFCIPNSIEEPAGYTPNLLIQNGANLVTCARDILDYYDYEEDMELTEMPLEYEEVYNFIGQLPISTNEIMKRSKKDISKVTEILCMLELDGYITNLPGNLYIRKV